MARRPMTEGEAAAMAALLDTHGYHDTEWGRDDRSNQLAVWYADYSGGPMHTIHSPEGVALLLNHDADAMLEYCLEAGCIDSTCDRWARVQDMKLTARKLASFDQFGAELLATWGKV